MRAQCAELNVTGLPWHCRLSGDGHTAEAGSSTSAARAHHKLEEDNIAYKWPHSFMLSLQLN